jgi:hypothetical protein
MSVAGVDWPEPGGAAEVIPLARGVALPSHVEVSDGPTLLVRLVLADYAEQLKVQPGHRVEVLWGGPTGGRSLPAEVTEVRSDPELRWILQITGRPRPVSGVSRCVPASSSRSWPGAERAHHR